MLNYILRTIQTSLAPYRRVQPSVLSIRGLRASLGPHASTTATIWRRCCCPQRRHQRESYTLSTCSWPRGAGYIYIYIGIYMDV